MKTKKRNMKKLLVLFVSVLFMSCVTEEIVVEQDDKGRAIDELPIAELVKGVSRYNPSQNNYIIYHTYCIVDGSIYEYDLGTTDELEGMIDGIELNRLITLEPPNDDYNYTLDYETLSLYGDNGVKYDTKEYDVGKEPVELDQIHREFYRIINLR